MNLGRSVCLALLLFASGCSRRDAGPDWERARRLAPAALRSYAEIAADGYRDSAQSAQALLHEVDALLAAPTPQSLDRARQAWLRARRAYTQTEVFRFYDGPIDKLELLINTWPIDENYVDSADAKRPGIVEDVERFADLSPAQLSALNMNEGETSVSTGFHVIEFLLWGRDQNPDGPGDRPVLDYVPGSSAHAARRRSYLRNVNELLLGHLQSLAAEWAPETPGNYRARFLALPALEALSLAIKGMGSLSGAELAGERLTVPYETKHQENEHSCFSDSTQADLVGNALGIDNVCQGRYQRLDGGVRKGQGLCPVFAALLTPQHETLAGQIAQSVAAVRAIPNPFDRAILGSDGAVGRRAIARAIAALQAQTETLSQLAQLVHVRAAEPRHE